MTPKPIYIRDDYRGSGRLVGKTALITGGDSGIGRAVAVHFTAEGAAAIGIVHLEEHGDAVETQRLVEGYGARCFPLQGDVTAPEFAERAVAEFVAASKREHVDVLVNNAAAQWPQDEVEQISLEQLDRTFRTNIYSYFLFTRSLASALVERAIRVNGVAPGPIWTPLIPASFPADNVASFGKDTPCSVRGSPPRSRRAMCSSAARMRSYMTGQTLHPNGGSFVTT